ncbi:unnamed protein product [Pylaiella littoralis]
MRDGGVGHTEIGETCPGRMGTPGYTAFEGMSFEPVKGAAGHDVVAIAMVLLRVCLKEEWRSPNLFTHPGLLKERETKDREDLLTRPNVAELAVWEFEVSRRTLKDGSFMRWLHPDKLHPALNSADRLLDILPDLLNPNTDEREDMDVLFNLARHLADTNKNA